jgi:hypothetical protein
MAACRDPLGIRPLVMGKLGDATVFASETVALDVVGADFVRQIEPGEFVEVDFDGTMRSHRPFGDIQPRPCIFEHVYFSRPDSVLDDRSVYRIAQADRRRAGQGSAGRGRPRGAGARQRRARGDRLLAAVGHPVRARHHPLALRRAHLHPAVRRRAPRRASSASTTPTASWSRASASC